MHCCWPMFTPAADLADLLLALFELGPPRFRPDIVRPRPAVCPTLAAACPACRG